MGLFDLFKKKPKTPEEMFRMKIRSSFDDSVKLAKKNFIGDPMLDGTLIESAIANIYNELRNSDKIQMLCTLQGIDDWKILREERDRALKMFFGSNYSMRSQLFENDESFDNLV